MVDDEQQRSTTTPPRRKSFNHEDSLPDETISSARTTTTLLEERKANTDTTTACEMDDSRRRTPPPPPITTPSLTSLSSSSSSSLLTISPSRETSRSSSPNNTDFEESSEGEALMTTRQEEHQQQQQQPMDPQQEFEEGNNAGNDNDSSAKAITTVTSAPPREEQENDWKSNNDNNNNNSSSVQVAVRIRPALASEEDYTATTTGAACCLSVLNQNSIRLGGPHGPQYTFDRVFGPSTLTHEIYQASVQRLVDACLEGYNATILAYGQTGSGKTHTILGPTLFGGASSHHHNNSQHDTEPDEDIGVLPRAIQALFQALESTGRSRDYGNDDDEDENNGNNNTDDDADEESSFVPRKQCDWTVRLQFLELYGEEIRDLLRPSATAVAAGSGNGSAQKLTIRDGGRDDEPEVPGATQVVVKSADEAAWAIRRGCLRRVTASTAMNASSSRSHALLTVSLEQRISSTTTTKARRNAPVVESDNDGVVVDGGDDSSQGDDESLPPAIIKRSKFHFVDLAGSERQKRTQAVGQRLKEGIDINKGLLVLGNVISALGGENAANSSNSNQPLFVPYRDSKLTRLLRGSLGGNHKTLMIACVSPSPTNLEESLNCLRYANRAKNIQNKAVVNVDAATRLVGELQEKIQLLAKDLLTHVYDNANVETEKCNLTFPRHAIQSMAALGGSSGGGSPMHHHHHHGHHQRRHQHHHHHHSATTSADDDRRDKKIRELELELFRSRQALEQSQKNHDAAEEELYVAKATSQVYQLQEQLALPEGETAPPPSSIHEAFVQKATSYEKEIRDLKKALAAAEKRAHGLATADYMMQQQQGGVDQEQLVMERARRELEADRHRLAHLAESLSHDDVEEDDTDHMSHELRIMKKYLVQGGMDEDEEEPTEDNSNTNGDTMLNEEQEQSPLEQEEAPVEHRQQRILKNDLVELTRGIAAKEDLIDQLKLSQEKYASMRHFYEEKLRSMENTLKEKEDEREQLVRKLNSPRNVADGPLATKLKEQLREKEQHIADLRRKQKQLQSLTAVSSRNEAEISRLQNDVLDMKRKKVDLQKLIGSERKMHATEVRRLQKDAVQKERELNKYKRISNQRETQAQKANIVAKARLEEIGSLRAKYNATQKKLRVQSVKRGVLAKAGLDPVLVGKRHHSQRKNPTVGNPSSAQRQAESLDPDALRDLFDQKVSEVVRKEALVNKLAEEWEEHFCLNQQKEEMEGKSDGDSDKDETLQSLSVQIQYKEDRIRQLAKRLAKQKTTKQNDGQAQRGIAQMDSFLFDSDYSKLSKDVQPEVAQKTLAKVLFGMVVRERKRTAALARTASSLDERLLAAEKATEASVAALNSYIEEQRLQLAEMSQSQQLQLLSLMEMVQEDSAHTIEDGAMSRRLGEVPSSPTRSDAMLLVLANERISILANQVQELDAQAATASLNQVKIEELASSLEATSREKKELEDELGSLRLAMKQLRTSIGPTWASGEEPTDVQVLQIASDALRPAPTLSPRNRRSPPPPSSSSPPSPPPAASPSDSSLRKHEVAQPLVNNHLDNLVEYSDSSDEDEEVPDWAASIINELAFIAKGEPPPALENSPGFAKELVQFEKDSVFDRLNDPKNFTGIQKQARVKPRRKPHALGRSPRSQEEKKLRPRDFSSHGQSDNSDAPQRHATKATHDPGKRHFSFSDYSDATPSTSGKEYRSVFDKLGSPSHATGTQKQKFAASKKSSSKSEEDADKLLDDILDSDGSDPDPPKPPEKESVFERLQKTATMSYAIKHLPESALQHPTSPTPHHYQQHYHQQQQQHPEQHHTPRTLSREKASSEQVTSPMDELLSEALGEAPPQSNADSDYTSQNVFERLTKTTTEAYAKKVHKVK